MIQTSDLINVAQQEVVQLLQAQVVPGVDLAVRARGAWGFPPLGRRGLPVQHWVTHLAAKFVKLFPLKIGLWKIKLLNLIKISEQHLLIITWSLTLKRSVSQRGIWTSPMGSSLEKVSLSITWWTRKRGWWSDQREERSQFHLEDHSLGVNICGRNSKSEGLVEHWIVVILDDLGLFSLMVSRQKMDLDVRISLCHDISLLQILKNDRMSLSIHLNKKHRPCTPLQ